MIRAIQKAVWYTTTFIVVECLHPCRCKIYQMIEHAMIIPGRSNWQSVNVGMVTVATITSANDYSYEYVILEIHLCHQLAGALQQLESDRLSRMRHRSTAQPVCVSPRCIGPSLDTYVDVKRLHYGLKWESVTTQPTNHQG
jgi:hypothetical protein